MIITKKELYFKVKSLYKGSQVWLRVWKGRLHAPINSDNTIVIYMRLGGPDFSVPFTKESCSRFTNDSRIKPLLNLGSFTFPLDKEEDIINILSKLKLKE